MQDWDKIEYEQSSQDWRHRDVLTWQYPAVLVLVGGILVAKAFEQGIISWLRNVLLGIGVGLALCLTVALHQNLKLQEKNKEICEGIYNQTERFKFCRIGSTLLLIFS